MIKVTIPFLFISCLLLSAAVATDPCKDGTYDDGTGKCFDCPQFCDKCTDAHKCTTCSSGTFQYQDICVAICPVHTTKDPSSDVCNLNCLNPGEFPEYSTANDYTCKAVTTELDPFCIQQIPNLIQDKTGFSFQIVNPSDKDNLHLKVVYFNTPSLCYTYKFTIGGEMIPSSSSSYVNGAYEQLYTYPINKLDPKTNTSCEDEKCSIQYTLYWKNMLQFTYTVEVKIKNSAVVLSGDIQISGDGNSTTPVCVGCSIPKELQLESSVSVTCQTTTDCSSSGTVKAVAGERIQVVQKIKEDKYSTNTMKPHSVELSVKDDTGADVGRFQITNYNVKNDVPGEITYEFSTIGFKTGILKVASKIDNVIIKKRMLGSNLRNLESSSANTKYPYHEVQVVMSSDGQNSSNNNIALGLIIGIVVAFAVALIAFFILGVYILRRRKQKRQEEKLELQNANQEDSAIHMNSVKQNQETKTLGVPSN